MPHLLLATPPIHSVRKHPVLPGLQGQPPSVAGRSEEEQQTLRALNLSSSGWLRRLPRSTGILFRGEGYSHFPTSIRPVVFHFPREGGGAEAMRRRTLWSAA